MPAQSTSPTSAAPSASPAAAPKPSAAPAAPKLTTPVSPYNKTDSFVGLDSKRGPVFSSATGHKYTPVMQNGELATLQGYQVGAPIAEDFLETSNVNNQRSFTPAPQPPATAQPQPSPTPTTSGAPATQTPAASPAPTTAPTTAPAQQQPQQQPAAAKPFDNFEQTLKAAPPEQQAQIAQQSVQQHMQTVPDETKKGVQDLAAGANTPEAKMFEQQVNETGQKAMQEQVDQQIQANPELASSPQGFGQMWNQAMDTWNSMPQEAKWMVGLGVPLGAVGLMSSLFGEGGAGMGLLGLLGLGAAGLGAAGGGLLGQDASNMVGDAAYNVGTFLGVMPEQADLSALTGDDPVGQIVNQSGRIGSREEVGQKIQAGQQQAQQLKQLMALPLGDDAKIQLMRRLDPRIDSIEAGQKVLQNAGTLLAAYDDPNSALQQKLQQSQSYANDQGTWRGWGKEQLAGWSDWWNGHGGLNAGQQKGASMDIAKAIEKWAFNDVDAKEMADLKAQQAEGVPYRVDDARRLNTLQKRQQAAAPLKKEVVISVCQKAARCWAGYEPVPGAKAYSRGSCRPKGSKKTQKEMKKS